MVILIHDTGFQNCFKIFCKSLKYFLKMLRLIASNHNYVRSSREAIPPRICATI